MHSTPRIGITTYGRDDRKRFSVPAAYVDSVRRAGGLPVLLAPGEPRISEWLELVDALILIGGGDVDPVLYGGGSHPELYGVDPERDATDIAAAREILRTGLPTLGICRGCQVINVAMGGTLIPHLPDVVGDEIAHRGAPGSTAPAPRHAVDVVRGSRLAEIMKATHTEPASSHHQAIKDVAPGLEVVARAKDGTIEAVEMPSHPWLIAVQWHPEITAAEDPLQQRLFDALVKRANEARAARRTWRS